MLLGLTDWLDRAPVLMAVPVGYCLAARLYGGRLPGEPLTWVAHAAAASLFVVGLASTARGFVLVSGDVLNLRLALFFAVGTTFYLLATALDRRPWTVYAVTAGGVFRSLDWW